MRRLNIRRLEAVYTMRDTVSQTFSDALAEFIQDATVLQSPITPHVFVSEIRRGSLDFQILYHGVVNLPCEMSHVRRRMHLSNFRATLSRREILPGGEGPDSPPSTT